MMISLFKRLFSKKLTEEQEQVWDELQKKPSNNPLDDPACQIDYEYAISLSHKERQDYLSDVWAARHRARVQQYTQEYEEGDDEDR